jgi:hypothetical protein
METIKHLLKLKQTAKSLPPLSAEEMKKLQTKADVDHVYNSSRLEGSRITKREIVKVAKAG